MYKRNCEIKPDIVFPERMSRVACIVEYNGNSFQGFQRQASANITVQGVLEQAFGAVADEPISLVCSGRTDSGVHAGAQVIHFDTLALRPSKAWVMGANCKLPATVRVRWANAVSNQFHSRFSAHTRTYRYVIYEGNVSSALLNGLVTSTQWTLDHQGMAKAAEYLLGEHDFSSFRAAGCQANRPVRTIKHIGVERVSSFVILTITANAFLYHMVRNIAGALIDVGRGAKSPEWMGELLNARDRNLAPSTAPSDGLYFARVDYPQIFSIPEMPLAPYFLP